MVVMQCRKYMMFMTLGRAVKAKNYVYFYQKILYIGALSNPYIYTSKHQWSCIIRERKN